jgi:hypothetical protein
MTLIHETSGLDTLSDDKITELFGWPVPLLDDIGALQELADTGQLGIEEWRRRDVELRASGPSSFPRDQAEAAHKAAVQAWIDAGPRANDKRRRMQLLATRLRALLYPAPDDQALRDQLARYDEMLSAERDRNVRERLRIRQRQLAHWLVANDAYDRVTGLPWDYLLRYRWLPDPVLGRVPAYLGVARTAALAGAPEETARLARQLRLEGRSGFCAITDELDQDALTAFPRHLIEAAARNHDYQDLATQIRRLWQAPAMQAFLLQETSRSWPGTADEPRTSAQQPK